MEISLDESSIKINESNDCSQTIFETKKLNNLLNDPNYLEKKIGIYFKELLPKMENKGDFCYCDNCNNLLLYFYNDIFSSLDKIIYSCKCTQNQKREISINEFFSKYIKNSEDKEKEIYQHLACNVCLNKYCSYCNNHGENFCEQKHLNKENNSHKDEILIRFDENIIINYIKYIMLKLNFNHGNYILDEKNDEETSKFNKFKYLINIIILNFIFFPTYNIYQNIKNLYSALTEYTVFCLKDKKSNKFKEGIEIINKNELEELEPDLYPLVININLVQSKVYDTAQLNPFENLEELNLRGNCISNIASFLNAKWKNLKTLNLAGNILGDENIEYFENIDLQNLVCLILDQNNFTNYDLFIAIAKNKKESFKKLEDLRLGINDFKVGKNNQNKKGKNLGPRKTLEELVIDFKDLDFSKVKKLYINNGVFNQKTANELIPLLNLKNLEDLDISYNHLTNFDFIEKCDWKIKHISYKGNHYKLKDEFKLKKMFKNI